MASIYKRDGAWVVKWKDGLGVWRVKRTACVTKAHAKRLAADLERKGERQAEGLEPLPSDDGSTLAELVRWWLNAKCPPASREIERLRLERHVCTNPALGALPLSKVTTEAVESALAALEKPTGPLSASSVNKLRTRLSTAFRRARKAKKWARENPIEDVERRKVPKRAYVTLRADEVPLLLAKVNAEWRNLFVAALYTGMRKGELCGLKKSDVDLVGRTLTVARSYDSETTKGRVAAVIPIAEPLVPFLRAAMDCSASDLVFPDPNGAMRTQHSDPQKVLRTALKQAGIVDGWEHVCRRCKREGRADHTIRFGDSQLRRCATCGMKLWPRAIPRPLRFHDLRHSSATLMLRAGVDPHRVQRILRHSNVTVTTGTYGHLVVEDLRSAVATLPMMGGLGAPVVRPGSVAPRGGAKHTNSERSRRDSNARPLASEASTLSS